MRQSIAHIDLVVRDDDEAIRFFTETLNFGLVKDEHQPDQDKRWVVVAPPRLHRNVDCAGACFEA